MQPIVPIVARTGRPEIDRNLDAIATAFRRLSLLLGPPAMAADDHEVKADAQDTGHGALDSKLLDDLGEPYPVVEVSGVRKVQLHDRKVASGPTDPGSDTLIAKLESSDNSIAINEDTADHRVDLQIPRPTVLPKRYYLTGANSDTPGDYLFSLFQPAAADLPPPGGSTYPSIFDSPVGEPGLTNWAAGVVTAHIVARVLNAHPENHMRYPMSFGTGDESAAILARMPESANYQQAPWPAQVLLTADYQTFVVPLFVGNLSGNASDRLRAWFRCNPQGGSITDEQFQIHLSDSYLETTFVDAGGGVVDHRSTSNRNARNADGTGQHQRRFVDDVALPPVSLDGSGNLTPDPTANIVLLSSEVTINRIDTSQWPTGCGRLALFFAVKGHIVNEAGSSGSFGGVNLGNFGGLSGAEAAQLDVGADAVVELLLIAGSWNLSFANAGST